MTSSIRHPLAALHPSVPARAATLPALLRQRASEHPDRLALRHKDRGIWRRVSWAEYDAQVMHLALFLRARGLGVGDCVAIVGDGSPGWFQIQAGVYERAGQPCRRCSGTVRQIRQAGRSTYYCPVCQR